MTELILTSRVLRHVKGTQHFNGDVDGAAFRVDGSAFVLRERLPDGTPETSLSVACLDVLGGADEERINEVRATYPQTVKATHRFAELTIEAADQAVRKKLDELGETSRHHGFRLFHTPVTTDKGEFFAHCDVEGLPLFTDTLSAVVGEAMSYAVTALHLAIAPKPA